MMFKRIRLVLGIALCLPVTSYAQGIKTFKVLSYNVENLWDDEPDNTMNAWKRFLANLPTDAQDFSGERSIQYSDYAADSSNWYDPKILDAKIQHVLNVVKWAGEPDILALQEIESAGNESHVFDMRGSGESLREGLEKMGYHEFILGHQNPHNPVSVTQAVISKIPLTELASVDVIFDENPYSTSARDIQVVEFKQGNDRLVIFNNHWKSKNGGKKTEIARIKTAELVKERIQEEKRINPATRIIVLGDLNSGYFEKPIEVLATGDERKMLEDKTSKLYNTWYEVSEDDRWETSFRGERQTLSAMLISDDFYLENGIQYIDSSFQVVGQSGNIGRKLLNADGTPFRWQVRKNSGYSTHTGKGYSDHLPLLASFKINSNAIRQGKIKQLQHKPFLQESSKSPTLKPDKVVLCTSEETVAIETIDFQNEDLWFNHCVSVEGDYVLETVKSDDNNRIHLSNGINVYITMTRSWDPRPNIDDSRVNANVFGKYFSDKMSSQSNKCFDRKVLHGKGGVLKKAVGRLGYNDGNIALFIPSRQEPHLVLSNLPISKQKACPWNEY